MGICKHGLDRALVDCEQCLNEEKLKKLRLARMSGHATCAEFERDNIRRCTASIFLGMTEEEEATAERCLHGLMNAIDAKLYRKNKELMRAENESQITWNVWGAKEKAKGSDDKIDLVACPFCGAQEAFDSDNALELAAEIKGYTTRLYNVVVCGQCGARGPVAHDEDWARQWWNGRHA